MRHAHYLSKTNGHSVPSQVIVVECHWSRERAGSTDTAERFTLHHGCLVKFRIRDGKALGCATQTFRTADEFWESVKKFAANGTLTWIFCYDLKMHFSALGLWDKFITGEATFEGHDPRSPIKADEPKGRRWSGYCVLENPPSIVQFRFCKRGGSIKAVDVRNYGVDSWSHIGADCNDLNWAMAEFGQVGQDLLSLTQRRAKGLMAWVEKLLTLIVKHKFGSLKETAASQAYYIYRHNFMDYQILVHENEQALELERQAYYGGRCEARFLGLVTSEGLSMFQDRQEYRQYGTIATPGKIHHYDVNSLYSSVCIDAMLPVKLEYTWQSLSVDELKAISRVQPVIARVTLSTEVPCVPMRLYRDNWGRGFDVPPEGIPKSMIANNIVMYPIGTFTTSLCGPELEIAFAHAKVLSCDFACTYAAAPIFARFVDYLYSMRLTAKGEDDMFTARFCKVLLNALYGKFAQRSRQWKRVPEAIALEPFRAWVQQNRETGELEQWRSFAWMVEKLIDAGEHPQSCPAIGAWVNSMARVFLWNLINTAGPENVYYYDTDSVFCNQHGADRLTKGYEISNDKLGAIRHVGSYESVDFRGYKYYVTPQRVVCAGLPNGSEVKRTGVAEIKYARHVMADLFHGQAPQPVEIRSFLPAPAVYKHGRRDGRGNIVPWKINPEK